MTTDSINSMVESLMNPDIIASQEQARQFIESNRVRANNARTVCGDGRFTPEQSQGYIRLFGGDEGILMVLKGAVNKFELDISNTELVARFGAVLSDIRQDDNPIGMHTDTHHLEPNEIGCGHVAKAISGETEHKNLSSEDVKELHVEVREAARQIVLDGSHAEQAVLLVHGMNWSVNSQDGGRMYFVVDVDRSLELIKKVVEGMGLENLTFEAAKEQFMLQMEATARVLAKGLNVFDVNFADDGRFDMEYVKTFPKAA